MSQPTTTIASNTISTTATTPPTHHMNTDSHAGKSNHPASPVADTNPTSNQSTGLVQNPTSAPSAPTNKHPNIERPPQPPAAQNQWDFLRSGDTVMPETLGRPQPPIIFSYINIQPLVNGVRTLDSGFRITATPPGGFPTPQLSQSTWCNVSQVLKEKWPQKEGAKAWVRTYRAKHESNAQNMVAKLKDAIAKIISDSDAATLVVSTPTTAVELVERLPPHGTS